MRKITEQAINAFYNSKPYKNRNTEVFSVNKVESIFTCLKLYETIIATLHNNVLRVTTGGFNTKTTLERLNGLKNIHIKTVKGQMYLNKQKWNGELIEIKQ